MEEPGCWRPGCSDRTSQRHPRLVALPQAAGRAVFPPELVDGAVVPAGTKVLLFTCKHQRKRPMGAGHQPARVHQEQWALASPVSPGSVAPREEGQEGPRQCWLPSSPPTRKFKLEVGILWETITALVPTALQGAKPLCGTAGQARNSKQPLKGNEIWIVWFSFFKYHTSHGWLFAAKSRSSPRTRFDPPATALTRRC